ncbi:MAG: patatin [Thermovibrio sp.]|nr:MAG: patatin [Thermovibrio sp.]
MKIGVTLSGGFVKGAAHIGFLKALEYKGLSPSYISGSSAGALVGFLYAYGMPLKEMERLGKKISWRKLARPNLKGGFFSLDGLYNFLTDLTGNPDISELKIPFAVTVVNLKTLKLEVKTEGSSADFVTASCSAPPIFSPWRIGNNYYVDGGLRNCLPAEVTRSMGAEVNICSNVNFPSREFNPKSLLEVTYRSSLSSIIENQESRLKYCDIVINHKIDSSPFDFSELEKLVDLGFRSTLSQIGEIENWL